MGEPRTRFSVGESDRGKRLDRFLHERIPGLSRARLQKTIRERVTLSWGASPRPARPVIPGGEVVIRPRPLDETPLRLRIPILARGEGWIAVDKPPGVPVHPANRVVENTLIRMVRRQQDDPALTLTHRLDRETSGALLLADNPTTARALARAFETGTIDKEYLALVRGIVDRDEGRIDLPIRPAEGSRVYVRLETGDGGRHASTVWRVERRLENRTLLRLRLLTGRRHQLRVHLAAIGHPILGDILYGRPDRDFLDMAAGRRDPRREEGGPTRQLLHCARLAFADPATTATREVEAPLPADFGEWLD